MSIYELKPKFQNLLRPVVRILARVGVTPNQVTISAFLLSLGVGIALFYAPERRSLFFLVPVVMFLRMALNAIDGMLAREHEMKTDLGAFLNELGDVFSDTILYLPFALIPGVSGVAVIFVVFLANMTEMAGVVAVQIGASRRYDGPFGKSDRAAFFGGLALLLALEVPLKSAWLNGILWGVCFLLMLTIFKRVAKALQENKK
jgi:CDP-diacylglycerol--glycerol-3-phosphate 3-phosphatidyltransferase